MKCCLVFLLTVVTASAALILEDERKAWATFRDIDVADESTFYSTYEMILMDGYPAENHYITTVDGYILNLHRIPSGVSGKKNGKVAYLQHGLLTASHDWVIAGPGKALGYILADTGYDVWLPNVRGNAYSRNHTTLNPDKDSEFWQFSWHEIGITDLPAIIDYIIEQTGVDSLYYAGHSQGSTSYYVMASLREEYNAKIKVFVHLAPIAYMNHMTSPLLQIISFFDGPISVLADLIGMNEFLPRQGFLYDLTADICQGGVGKILCKNTLFALCGFSPGEMNMTLLPTIMTHVPAGASTKQLLHYGQEIRSGHFRQYDFGLIENMKIYGHLAPPDYDLSKITSQGYLIYGPNDWLAAETDVDRLVKKLGRSCLGKFLVAEKNFNHLDFVYGINAPGLVYNKVISLFARH